MDKTVTTVYVAGMEIELHGTTEDHRTVYYSGGGAFRVIGSSDEGVYYRLTDNLGSTSVIAREDGTEKTGSRVTHAPYGTVRSGTQSTLTDFGYTGQRHDDATGGLMYYGSRYYEPGLGRFISTDTIVPDPSNPQALNKFSYAVNNPLNRTDPTGHDPICPSAQACGAIVGALVGSVVGGAVGAVAGPTGSFLGSIAGAVAGAALGAAVGQEISSSSGGTPAPTAMPTRSYITATPIPTQTPTPTATSAPPSSSTPTPAAQLPIDRVFGSTSWEHDGFNFGSQVFRNEQLVQKPGGCAWDWHCGVDINPQGYVHGAGNPSSAGQSVFSITSGSISGLINQQTDNGMEYQVTVSAGNFQIQYVHVVPDPSLKMWGAVNPGSLLGTIASDDWRADFPHLHLGISDQNHRGDEDNYYVDPTQFTYP